MFKVKALYDYASGHEDDLEFTVGQIITVTDEVDDDWYGGEYVDESGIKHEGIFPRNFVEKYEPTAPPRPTRSRPKKEPEVVPAPAPEAPAAAAPPAPPPDSPKQATPEPEETPKPAGPAPSSETSSAAPRVPAPVAKPPAPQPVQPVQPVQAPAPAPAPAPPAPQPAQVPSAASPPAPKSGPSSPKPSGPPPVSEKPTSSSFKDRIAAFNKPAAPPIAPFKPGNLSSSGAAFIKKPFVAPPPSRNAYIPPPSQVPVAKIYRREEDPEVKEQEAEVLENAGKAGLIPTASTNEGQASEDQPKPMSLKERLALLQKQQMETAARHAEAAAKKEKSKRLPKKRLDSQDTVEGESAERTEETTRTSTDEAPPPRVAHPPRRRSSKGTEPRDGNEADMSGAGETTEGQEELTERDDSDGKPKHVASASKQEDSSRDEGEEDEEEEEEEEEIDPEIRRREELRARMAKMSGGMGMPGMGMPLFGAPAPILPKKKKAVPEKRVEEAEEPTSPTARAPPVPLPGLMRPPPAPEPKQPGPEEEGDEEEKEEDEESQIKTPHQEAAAPPVPLKESDVPPPVPGGRPAPPPVPADCEYHRAHRFAPWNIIVNLVKHVRRHRLQLPLRSSRPAKDRCRMTNSRSDLSRSLVLPETV
ncbi:hypothetical protein MYCTH_2310222 [Thermothelomyces thermophilus ATCC 42464]|uniref:SH3 domain-containing protein n=1 Tax=Thermothelomyces thermophilus (strain ATCC 42464 / BCRC 31852 / DSM 1799) TaxID=573729 RepID=G2QL72_THET4|nr:uncharacterized protein MYCTH_2310222 [Thermothelomyces thermophilus ATCC 42464]AEO60704.1 hypothetical protein MYCTH_2310222 [Thermothelomyces thermophilus ATCC 42464]